MTDSECIPVHVALSLMDTSTLGKADREPDFLHMYNQIQKTLKAIVNGLFSLEWPCSRVLTWSV
jgi:Xaa-Pro aminopeptidase